MQQLEFYFDCVSPSAYLGFKPLRKICQQPGAEIVYKTILLGDVFGAPAMFVNGVMHFAQDRLDFAEEAEALQA